MKGCTNQRILHLHSKRWLKRGFRLTAHAGEFGGPESVRAALDDLKVERIGHGVRGGGRCRFAGQAGGRGTSAGNLPWFQRIAGRLSRSGQPLYRGVAGGWGEMHGFQLMTHHFSTLT